MELRKSSGNSENPLYRLSEEIHTVIAATIDEEGLPVTCAIDIMDRDSDSLYFLTARGKGFYHRLKARPFIALTGIKGNNTMSSIAISIRGKTEDAGDDILQHLLEKNSYMYEIYPTEESRKALVAFRIHEGSGELFDLSTKPITRKAFSFGMKEKTEELFITESCYGDYFMSFRIFDKNIFVPIFWVERPCKVVYELIDIEQAGVITEILPSVKVDSRTIIVVVSRVQV